MGVIVRRSDVPVGVTVRRSDVPWVLGVQMSRGCYC